MQALLCRMLWLLALAATGARAGLVETVAAVRPSVLAVGTYNPLGSPRFAFRGTGFVVGDGTLVVTNAHVLPEGKDADPAARLTVALPGARADRDARAAAVVAHDPEHDLALLKIDGPPLPALRLGDSAAVREGQAIALVGYPIGAVLGITPATHRGIVAAVTAIAIPATHAGRLDERNIRRLRQGAFTVFQLDATAYPGNSGSPLVDAETGAVLGVVNMVLVKATRESALSQPTGISYAIPASHVVELLKPR